MAEPVLDAGDVGLVLEGVGGGGGPERVDDALHGDGGGRGVLADELVDAVAGKRPAGPAGLGRLEPGCIPVAAVAGELEVVAECRERSRVDRAGPGLGALAGDKVRIGFPTCRRCQTLALGDPEGAAKVAGRALAYRPWPESPD